MTRMVRMFAEEVREGDRIESPSGQWVTVRKVWQLGNDVRLTTIVGEQEFHAVELVPVLL